MIKGIGASSGIAIAKAYKLVMPDLTVTKVTVEDAEAEIKKFDDAMSQTAKELESIKEAAAKNLSAEEAAVFDAHALVLQDPELKTQVEDKIRNEKINADAALDEVANTFIAMFESMDDDYFRERAADIKDVSRRLLANLLGKSLPNPALIDEEVVIIADDLTPSDTAQLNKNLVRGFATNIGGRTSHSAIMARSLEIPAVVSCKTITDETNDADMVVLDGEAGIVIINPSDDEIKEYQAKREAFIAYKEELKKMKNEKSVTLDDHHVELVANIGSPKDIQGVLDNGGEGVGLFRTEFLYMESAQLPTEEEQFNVYKEVLEGLEGKPAVVRTLDIGGDKEIEAIDLPKEMNPFLGVRAVRLCFQREDIFRVQLRALLRASVYGDLRIMFPMIATLDEFRKANIKIKTIRITKEGKMKESMSFPTFKFKELVQEEWEDSTLRNTFMDTKFLLCVFDEIDDKTKQYRFRKSLLWNMPESDLDTTVKEVWEDTKQKAINGIELIKQSNNKGQIYFSNNLIKGTDKKIVHVRPHAAKAIYKFIDGTTYGDGVLTRDGDELPNGVIITKQCFFLNNSYILESIVNNR